MNRKKFGMKNDLSASTIDGTILSSVLLTAKLHRTFTNSFHFFVLPPYFILFTLNLKSYYHDRVCVQRVLNN